MRLHAAILALLLIAPSCLTAEDVRVWQETLTLPTYEEGLPDPNPAFDIFATTRFNYPYTLRTNLTDLRADHTWRAVYLENEYLKCSVLPDLGGHLYTCIDKISGQPMFYANPSIKKAEIGYRGAWAAFGIEFNFPVSHNWVSISPVDFAYTKHDDGSASVTVGNIDRVYGMEWSVELVLRPASTVLEERIRLSNRSDVRHRFYWWNNAGVQVWDDSRIQYPMRFAASHGFKEIQPWPVDPNGSDLSIIANQKNGPVSLFVHGSREPFMGVWNPHTNTGTVHYADYAQLPAKKIWSWGSDAEGLNWRKVLSDNNSAYVEIQGGLFRNQETYGFLEPRQSIHFSEYWMPVRDLGGIARANLTGVLNLNHHSKTLIASLNVNQKVPQASIRIMDGDRVLRQEQAELVPERTWKGEFVLPDPERHYTFELRDPAKKTLLRHTEGEYDWTPVSQIKVGPQPSYEPSTSPSSDGEWFELGINQELNGATLMALETYERGLTKFPNSFVLRKAAGRVAACLQRYEEAVRFLESVHQRDTSDPEISYYLGLAYDARGEVRKAQGAYEAAQRMPDFRAAGALRLGELLARQGQLHDAKPYFEKALQAAPDDLRAAEELVAVEQASGAEQTARAVAHDWLHRYPLDYFLLEELGHPDLQHLGADPDRVLNVATEYMRLGLYASALRVLSRQYPSSPSDQSEPGAVLPQDHAMVAYFRAFCKEKMSGARPADYGAASRLSTRYIFPNRPEAFQVLDAALRTNPSDGTAQYLLGTLLFSRGLTDTAIEHWELARKISPQIPVLKASLGAALLRVKKGPERALTVFQEGITSDPRNSEIYSGLDQSLSVLERPAGERVQALERYPDPAHMPTALVYELALNRAEANDFTGAIDLFRNRFFPSEEGGTNVRQVWVEVRLQQALSLQRAGNCSASLSVAQQLGAEVPGFLFTHDALTPILDAARTQFLLGMLESNCGEHQDATQHFERAAKQTSPAQIVWAYAAARQLGNANEAEWKEKLRNSLAQAQANSDSEPSSFWAYTTGCLQTVLQGRKQADPAFEQALLLSNQSMAYHLTRLARAGTIPE